MKYAPMTRFERRGEDPKEATRLRRQIHKRIEPLDERGLQALLRWLDKRG